MHTYTLISTAYSHLHSRTVYQSKKGFLWRALNKGRSPLHFSPPALQSADWRTPLLHRQLLYKYTSLQR